MLQNDMGNTLIQDSKTGHIMGLSEGFVPVGLKEHGGIMYIASVNKDGVGEIGTIPSPVLTLSLRAVDMDAVNDTLVNKLGPVSIGAFISEKKIYPGEKFLPILNLQREQVNTEFFIYSNTGYQDFLKDKDLISHAGPNAYKGLYKMQLYSVYNSTNTELTHVYDKPLDVIPTQKAEDTWTGTPYWFIDGNWADIDIQQTYLNKGFLSYPGNIPPGKLLIKAALEEINFFQPIRSKQTAAGSKQKAPTLAPYVERTQDDATRKVTYILHFPGFEYQTGSIRFIKSLDVSVRNAQTGEILPLNSASTTSLFEKFNTVEVIQGLQYQIQTGENSIEVDDNTGWTPVISNSLFAVSIGENLNQWYELVVKYYDWCGGEIGVYKYTFNPYHVLYLEDNYYNEDWIAGDTIDYIDKSYKGSIHIPTNGYTYSPNDWYVGTISLQGQTLTYDSLVASTDDSIMEATVPITMTYSERGVLQADIFFKGVDDYSYLWKEQAPKTINLEMPTFLVHANGLDLSSALESKLPHGWYYEGHQLVAGSNTIIEPDIKNISGTLSFEVAYSNQGEYIFIKPKNTNLEIPIDFNGIATYQIPYTSLYDETCYGVERFTKSWDASDWGTWSCGVELQGGVATDSYGCPHPMPTPVDIQFGAPDYTIVPSFSRFGYDDKNVLTPLGYNRQGLPSKAWTWDKNLLETTLNRDGIDPENTFDPTGRYYPADFDEGQIILSRPGWYLLNIDTTQQTGAASINIKIQNNVDLPWTLEQGYFLPQLLYIPEDHTMLTISWSNVERLQGIGLYEVSRELLFIEGSELNNLSKPALIYYQHDDFIQGREPILQAAAAYHEDVMCLGTHYDYYAGMPALTMTNLKKIEDEIISFIYKYNPEDKLYTLIGDDRNPTKFRTDKTQS